MGDKNPIHTLEDYSKPSHEGYRNTIELSVGNNVVPLRSDTIRLVRNGCSFHGLRPEDLNQHLKDFLKLVDSLDFDGENRERTHMRKDHKTPQQYPDVPMTSWRISIRSMDSFQGLTPKSPSSWHRLLAPKDLALYNNESWNDPMDFAKPVKYCMENPEQAFVDYASSRTDEAGGLVSEFMASQDARLSKFEVDFKQQQSEMTNKIDTVLKAITDRIAGKLPSDTVKNSKLGQEEKGNLGNINSNPHSQPDPLASIATEHVRKLNSILELLGLVAQSSNMKIFCSKENDEEVMFIEIIRDDDEPKNESLYKGNFTYVVDFMIVEDISSIIDPRLSQVVLGRPFIEVSNMTHDLLEGVVRFTNENDKVASKMPQMIEQYNSFSNLKKRNTQNRCTFGTKRTREEELTMRRVLIREMEALGERGVAVDSLESLKQTHARETAKLAALIDAIAKSLADIYEKKHHLHSEGLLENIDEESFDKCESCISGKMTKKPFNKNIERATDLLGLIHTDVCGPLRHVSRKGASYFLTFTDDFSRYGYVFLLKHKHEVFETFKVFKAEVELQLRKKIKALQSDRGGEYLSQKFKDYLSENKIVQNLTSPYTPQQNGVSERRNRTLLDMVRSMFNLTTLPLSFWDYALESAVRILNMVPTKKAYVKRDSADKLQQRSVKCIFVGYPKETMGYYFYFPPENKVIVARYGDFLERDLISQKFSGRDYDLEDDHMDTLPSENTSKILVEPKRDLGEPANYKTVMLDPNKTDMDGKVHIYKARLITKGCTQTFRIHYQETFSHVADIRAIRILIDIAAYYDYEIWQMDVKTAFLNGRLDKDIYMEQPEGLKEVKDYLGKCFSVKDLGEAAYILGIKIYRDRSLRLIGLNQSSYIDKILKKFNMQNSKKAFIPMEVKHDLSNEIMYAASLKSFTIKTFSKIVLNFLKPWNEKMIPHRYFPKELHYEAFACESCQYGDVAFKILAPRIYMIESMKDIQVATKLSHVDLEWSFRRKSRGGAEHIQMTILKEILEGCILSDTKDRWTWSL
nr:hypothetical protein [Tanacetum cinerariifolium]